MRCATWRSEGAAHWLSHDECLALYDLILAQYVGAIGPRALSLPESALDRPQQPFHYGKPTLAELAAAYSAGIVKNHPFVDGNKRTGFMMGGGFLGRDGCEFFASEADAVVKTLGLAAGNVTEADYAGSLRANSRGPGK
jgi:death on curing protein